MFEFSRENSYFERIRMVRMVRMVRSLADRTFQLWRRLEERVHEGHGIVHLREHVAISQPGLFQWTNYDSTGGRGHFRPACLPTIFSTVFRRILSKFREKMQKFLEIH